MSRDRIAAFVTGIRDAPLLPRSSALGLTRDDSAFSGSVSVILRTEKDPSVHR